MADHPRRNDVVIEIQEMLDNAQAPMTNRCCIYRVPHGIRKLNKDAYTPRLVSIGPYHYGSPKLRNMESHKLIYFKSFTKRANADLEILVRIVQELERTIRSCYSENVKHGKTKLVKIILVDAGFILELFHRHFHNEWDDEDLPLNHRLIFDIKYDLLLLENQLPFFVLDKLYNIAFCTHPSGNYPSLLRLTFSMFDDFNSQYLDSECVITKVVRIEIPPRIGKGS